MTDPAKRLRIPCATYRVQFNRDFTFKMGRDLVDYLNDLGITDCYASPIFLAPPDSNHGYDVCDYNRLNPVLGNEKDWADFADALRTRKMGLLLDFVPNHMSTNPELNTWWRDVLEYGAESPHAAFFDIDWNPSEASLKNRVLLPILEDHYGRVLEQGLFSLSMEAGKFVIKYREHKFPVNPRGYRHILELIRDTLSKTLELKVQKLIDELPVGSQAIDRSNMEQVRRSLAQANLTEGVNQGIARSIGSVDPAQGADFIHELLESQAYRLAFWRTGTRTANYRRFFDVDSLIAVNMERPEVFRAAHELLFRCVREGKVTGLRLDHIDGLADPGGYLKALQNHLAALVGLAIPSDDRVFYIVVEKITMANEHLRGDWPVFGTTGYEFGNSVTGILVDGTNEKAMTEIYSAFIGYRKDFKGIVENSKSVILNLAMSKEVSALCRLLGDCASMRRETRDLLRTDLTLAIRAMLTFFPVYRTYITPGQHINPEDSEILEHTFSDAQLANPNVDSLAFDFLRQVLLRNENEPSEFGTAANLFRCRFQQLTGPIMAKSYEDTAFFIFNRLIALNEVGGNPGCFGVEPHSFHETNTQRGSFLPHSMLATSTHDTKLSEDVRARVAVLSEVPARWTDFLTRAASANAAQKSVVAGKLAPDANEEYVFYQILLGTWPLEDVPLEKRKVYVERLQRQMLKASREAKINTRWDAPNHEWESALSKFVELTVTAPIPEFTEVFLPLANLIVERGMVNSLSQTLLKLTVPGVPDIYQGNELWQFILTDPDNRRPIDFALRREILTSLGTQSPGALLADWRSGAIKMFVMRKVLQFRRENPILFEQGEYVPLACAGEHKNSCVGFARVLREQIIIVLVPRLTCALGFPPIGNCWAGTKVGLSDLSVGPYRNLFTGETFKGTELALSEVFRKLPLAVLVAERDASA